jgi:hypothetical protein
MSLMTLLGNARPPRTAIETCLRSFVEMHPRLAEPRALERAANVIRPSHCRDARLIGRLTGLCDLSQFSASHSTTSLSCSDERRYPAQRPPICGTLARDSSQNCVTYPHGLWNGHPTHLARVLRSPTRTQQGETPCWRHTHALVCREFPRGIERDDAFIRPSTFLLT